jgi:hypothetical protein
MSKANPLKRNAKGQFVLGTAGGPGRPPAPKKLSTSDLLSLVAGADSLGVDAVLAAARAPIPDGLPPHVQRMVEMKQRMAEAAQRVLLKRLVAELGE